MDDYRRGLKLFGVLLKDGTIIAGIETFRLQTKSLGMNFSRGSVVLFFTSFGGGQKAQVSQTISYCLGIRGRQ